MKKRIYLFCAILGLIVPWSAVPLLSTPQEPLGAMFGLLFANAYSASFTADLVFSIFVFWIFVINETRRSNMRNAALYMLSAAFIGLAFTLPLFLCFREQKLASMPAGS